jgi:hypothetical protein
VDDEAAERCRGAYRVNGVVVAVLMFDNDGGFDLSLFLWSNRSIYSLTLHVHFRVFSLPPTHVQGMSSCTVAPVGTFANTTAMTSALLCAPGTIEFSLACSLAFIACCHCWKSLVASVVCKTHMHLFCLHMCISVESHSAFDNIFPFSLSPSLSHRRHAFCFSYSRNFPSGTYSPFSGLTRCLNCPSQSFCPLVGASASLPCPSSTNITGQSVCGCVAGLFLNASAMRCDLCPLGSFCPAVTSASLAYPCPEGTFGNTTGLRAATCSGLCQTGYQCAAGAVVSAGGLACRLEVD